MNFKQYEKMVNSAAWKVVNKYGIPFEDCLSESYLIYAEAVQKYDKQLASFSTFLYTMLQSRLISFAKKTIRYNYKWFNEYKQDYDSISYIPGGEKYLEKVIESLYIADSAITELSEDALYILEFVLEMDNIGEPVFKSSIKDAFLLGFNWANGRFVKAIKELQIWWRGYVTT